MRKGKENIINCIEDLSNAIQQWQILPADDKFNYNWGDSDCDCGEDWAVSIVLTSIKKQYFICL